MFSTNLGYRFNQQVISYYYGDVKRVSNLKIFYNFGLLYTQR